MAGSRPTGTDSQLMRMRYAPQHYFPPNIIILCCLVRGVWCVPEWATPGARSRMHMGPCEQQSHWLFVSDFSLEKYIFGRRFRLRSGTGLWLLALLSLGLSMRLPLSLVRLSVSAPSLVTHPLSFFVFVPSFSFLVSLFFIFSRDFEYSFTLFLAHDSALFILPLFGCVSLFVCLFVL